MRLGFLAAAVLALSFTSAYAAPPANVSSTVGVCDPTTGAGASCIKPNSNGSINVSATTSAAASSNLSGTVTLGGTFQQIAASSTTRLSFEFQNISLHNCYVYFGTNGAAATTNSITVTPGQDYLRASGSIPSEAIQITCTTTSDAFYAEVQ